MADRMHENMADDLRRRGHRLFPCLGAVTLALAHAGRSMKLLRWKLLLWHLDHFGACMMVAVAAGSVIAGVWTFVDLV